MIVNQEVAKRLIPAVKNEATKLLWHNSLLTTLTENGLSVFSFSKDVQSKSKDLNFVEYAVDNSKICATADIIPASFVPKLQENIEYTQLIIDPVFWPHNPQLESEAARITSFKWSPAAMKFNNQHILLTLTCIGNVELLTFDQNKWIPKYNVTQKYLEINPVLDKKFKTVDELKSVLDIYASSAICWQPEVEKNYCYFVTAQKNGLLIFWVIIFNDSTLSLELKSSYQVNCKEIMYLFWIEKSDGKFILLSSDFSGQVYFYEFCIVNGGIINSKTSLIWEYEDKMIVEELTWKSSGDKFILMYGKNRHLIVQLLNENGEVLDQLAKNINDFKINTITKAEGTFYIGTANCKIYCVQTNVTCNKLNIDLTSIQVPKDVSHNTHELHSISFSKDNNFFCLGFLDITICYRKQKSNLEVIIVNRKQPEKIISDVLDNPDKKITDSIWQDIEYLRQQTLKNKSLPEIDFFQLYKDGQKDIYKLKIYSIFLYWYHYLQANFISVTNQLPETSIERVKENILFLHALSLFGNIFKKSDCNEFEKEVLVGTKKYLLYYCEKYQLSIDNYISIQDLKKVKLCAVCCQSCDEDIQYFSCKNNHFNLFCILTFTPIDCDYLTCSNCSAVASSELLSSNSLCVFCDLPLSVS